MYNIYYEIGLKDYFNITLNFKEVYNTPAFTIEIKAAAIDCSISYNKLLSLSCDLTGHTCFATNRASTTAWI